MKRPCSRRPSLLLRSTSARADGLRRSTCTPATTPSISPARGFVARPLRDEPGPQGGVQSGDVTGQFDGRSRNAADAQSGCHHHSGRPGRKEAAAGDGGFARQGRAGRPATEQGRKTDASRPISQGQPASRGHAQRRPGGRADRPAALSVPAHRPRPPSLLRGQRPARAPSVRRHRQRRRRCRRGFRLQERSGNGRRPEGRLSDLRADVRHGDGPRVRGIHPAIPTRGATAAMGATVVRWFRTCASRGTRPGWSRAWPTGFAGRPRRRSSIASSRSRRQARS